MDILQVLFLVMMDISFVFFLGADEYIINILFLEFDGYLTTVKPQGLEPL